MPIDMHENVDDLGMCIDKLNRISIVNAHI